MFRAKHESVARHVATLARGKRALLGTHAEPAGSYVPPPPPSRVPVESVESMGARGKGKEEVDVPPGFDDDDDDPSLLADEGDPSSLPPPPSYAAAYDSNVLSPPPLDDDNGPPPPVYHAPEAKQGPPVRSSVRPPWADGCLAQLLDMGFDPERGEDAIRQATLHGFVSSPPPLPSLAEYLVTGEWIESPPDYTPAHTPAHTPAYTPNYTDPYAHLTSSFESAPYVSPDLPSLEDDLPPY